MQGIASKFKVASLSRWALRPTPTMPPPPTPTHKPTMPLPPTDPKSTPTQIKIPLPLNTHIHWHCHATHRLTHTTNPLYHHRPSTQTHSATTATQPRPSLQGRRCCIGRSTPTSATTTITRGFGFKKNGVLGLRRGESSCRQKQVREEKTEKWKRECEKRA